MPSQLQPPPLCRDPTLDSLATSFVPLISLHLSGNSPWQRDLLFLGGWKRQEPPMPRILQNPFHPLLAALPSKPPRCCCAPGGSSKGFFGGAERGKQQQVKGSRSQPQGILLQGRSFRPCGALWLWWLRFGSAGPAWACSSKMCRFT